MLDIKDLKEGDWLLCTHPEYFKDKSMNKKAVEYISKGLFLITKSAGGVIVLGSGDNEFFLTVLHSEIKYFKKKGHDFNSLIDAAQKALNDGLIENYCVSKDGVNICTSPDEFLLKARNNEKSITEAIKVIQSLYKETFVIEREEDIKRIRSYPSNKEPLFDSDKAPKATLSNGNVVHVFRKDEDIDNVCVYMRSGLYKNYLDFEVLKGATVEQNK